MKDIHRQNEMKEQDSLSTVIAQIDNKNLHEFLMIPKTEPAANGVGLDDPYRAYWDKIKQIVASILPRLSDPSKWSEYRYKPVQDEEGVDADSSLWNTARGRMLFKFDPDHEGKRKTLLIFETDIQKEANMEWN